MPLYAEGRVEHQKRSQTATTLWPFGFVFGVQLGSLEKKKTRSGAVRAALFHIRNKSAIGPFGFVFGVQLGLQQTRALIKTKKNKLLQMEILWDK